MTFRLMSCAEITAWYENELKTAFVAQERKPLADIFRLIDEGRYEIWGLFDGDSLLGYACLWKSSQVSKSTPPSLSMKIVSAGFLPCLNSTSTTVIPKGVAIF